MIRFQIDICNNLLQWYVEMASNVGFQIHAWQDVLTYKDEKTGFNEVYPFGDWQLANGTSLTAYHQRSRWNTTGSNFEKKHKKP